MHPYPSSFHSDLGHNSWLMRAHRRNGHCYAAHFRASKRNSLTSMGCRGTGACPSSSSRRHQHQRRHRQRGQEGQTGREDRRAHRLCAPLRARQCYRWTMARCAQAREGNGDDVLVSVHGWEQATTLMAARYMTTTADTPHHPLLEQDKGCSGVHTTVSYTHFGIPPNTTFSSFFLHLSSCLYLHLWGVGRRKRVQKFSCS